MTSNKARLKTNFWLKTKSGGHEAILAAVFFFKCYTNVQMFFKCYTENTTEQWHQQRNGESLLSLSEWSTFQAMLALLVLKFLKSPVFFSGTLLLQGALMVSPCDVLSVQLCPGTTMTMTVITVQAATHICHPSQLTRWRDWTTHLVCCGWGYGWTRRTGSECRAESAGPCRLRSPSTDAHRLCIPRMWTSESRSSRLELHSGCNTRLRNVI